MCVCALNVIAILVNRISCPRMVPRFLESSDRDPFACLHSVTQGAVAGKGSEVASVRFVPRSGSPGPTFTNIKVHVDVK